MIHTTTDTLYSFLRQLSLASNKKEAEKIFKIFEERLSGKLPSLTEQSTRSYHLACHRLAEIGVTSEIMQRISKHVHSTLKINPILTSHLQHLMGDEAIENSCIDSFILAATTFKINITYSDLYLIFGSDWGGKIGCSLFALTPDPHHALKVFFKSVIANSALKKGTQWGLWIDRGVPVVAEKMITLLKLAKEGKLAPPSRETLEKLQDNWDKIYVPIGFSNHMICNTFILSIDYALHTRYRLRILSADGGKILATEDEDHFCPEVIWEDLSIDDLLKPSLWKPLLEVCTLKGEEQYESEDREEYIMAFNSEHVIPWLTLKLGKRPKMVDATIKEEMWERVLQEYYRPFTTMEPFTKNSPVALTTQTDVVLIPTGKKIKRTLFVQKFRKFINLIPLDFLATENERLLFKAESRLMALVGAYLMLKENKITPQLREDFIKLLKLSFGKIASPLEKLTGLNMSEKEREATKILLTSLLDLKARLNSYISASDKIVLSVPTAPHSVHQMKMSEIKCYSLIATYLESFRVGITLPPLPSCACWSSDQFPELFASLEKWYDLLLDAKNKCEPIELVMIAHKNVFSRLPIPMSNRVEDVFPGGVTEGLALGALLTLKKISSLIASEVYSENLVPPHFIVDMVIVYRFAIELYRYINPAVTKMPVSWFALHQYLQSRHSLQLPGEVHQTLERLVASFQKISPKGHLRTSYDNQEIPLFYYSWRKFSSYMYYYHREKLGPLSYDVRTVDEVLLNNELAGILGMKPEDVLDGDDRNGNYVKWETTFAGQTLLAASEIAQYHTLSLFVATSHFQKQQKYKYFEEFDLLGKVGPEDFLKLPPVNGNSYSEHTFNFGMDMVNSLVEEGEIPHEQRMVTFADTKIGDVINKSSVLEVDKWRDQAELIKTKGKNYPLEQATTGPSTLSIDVLLEYFETHSSLLLNRDYRAYFLAIIRSASVFKKRCDSEPLLIKRLFQFIAHLIAEDQKHWEESNLHLERTLWIADLIRYLCRIESIKEFISPLFKTLLEDLHTFGKGKPYEDRIAHRLLSGYLFVPFNISLVERARLHLLMGISPPAQDEMNWLDLTEAMFSGAREIQNAFISGEESVRRELWSLVLNRGDVEEVLSRSFNSIDSNTVLKLFSLLQKSIGKMHYFAKLKKIYIKRPWRLRAWKKEAIARIFEQNLNPESYRLEKELKNNYDGLKQKTEELICYSDTVFCLHLKGNFLFCDWETGRIQGGGDQHKTLTQLPIYLRKHPDFAPLGSFLRRPLVDNRFQGNEFVSVDLKKGMLFFEYENCHYRLISESDHIKINLPEALEKGFTVWVNPDNEGLIVAHDEEGAPLAVCFIDSKGIIRPLGKSSHLQLGASHYYSEAQMFERFGIAQKDILIWLDDDLNVAELYLPLSNGEEKFTRVVRSIEGEWFVEGLELTLIPTQKAIAAFAGHPEYLLAKNKQGQTIVLLPGVSPFEIKERKEKKNQKVEWNEIFTRGTKEGLHQYRLYATGQVEGLTVTDNLYLMMWMLIMGHFKAGVELAKRWLTPPGRAYTKQEQDILSCWINLNRTDSLMGAECHPSAMTFRLYVIVRMARHLREYPPETGDLAKSLVGPRDSSYHARGEIERHFMSRALLRRQFRGSRFEELISSYDQECAIRFLLDNGRPWKNPLSRHLYKRLGGKNEINEVSLTFGIFGRDEIYKEGLAKHYIETLFSQHVHMAQDGIVPVAKLYKSILLVDVRKFFDKAYTLIKNGPKGLEEKKEYDAILHTLLGLRGDKQIDLCNHYFSLWFSDTWSKLSILPLLYWLILEEAFKAELAGETLPELPSQGFRFGLVLKESLEETKEFFNQILSHSGKKLHQIFSEYRIEWFNKRRINFVDQDRVPRIAPPQSFYDDLKATWSTQLTEELKRWSALNAPMEVKNFNLDVKFSKWSYPMPDHWVKEELSTIKSELAVRLQTLRTEKKKAEKTLLTLANALPPEEDKELLEMAKQVHYVTPRSVDECIGLALIGRSEEWAKNCSVAAPLNLQKATLRFLEVALEEAHLQRIKKELGLCLQNPEDRDLKDQLKETLSTFPHYLPATATVPLMVAEYYSNCRLRDKPDQARLIEILTNEKDLGSIIQAIMGSGKSKMLAPVWLQKMLGTGRLPILCVPSSLFRTTISDLQSMMWDRFKTHVRAFTFEREKCNEETLYHLVEKLYVARTEPTVFVCAPRDLHALQLMLKERHQLIEEMRTRLNRFTTVWAKSCMDADDYKTFKKEFKKEGWNCQVRSNYYQSFQRWVNSHSKLEVELIPLIKESDLIQSILNLLQFESALLVDEVATAYDPRNLLSFPIGWQTQANPSAAAMGCKIYFEWLPQFYAEFDILNNNQSLSQEKVRQEIIHKMASVAWNEYKEIVPDLPSLSYFTSYLLSDEKEGRIMQAYINQWHEAKNLLLNQIAQELAFLKYALTAGLEGAFSMIGHVNYGRSKQDPNLYLAIPYQCANVPKENTLFRKPWKTVLMTCQYYSQCWNDPNQTAEMIAFLQGIDPTSKEKSILEAAKAIWGRAFSDADFSDKTLMQKLTEDLDLARKNPEKGNLARLLISNYLQSCVFPSQLRLDPSQLTSTPQDLPLLSVKADAMGGTFGFETTWNTQLVRVPDLSSDESVLKALQEPRNKTCTTLPHFDALFEGILEGYMALIDSGALFKGISNTTVATRLFKALKNFDCILFYDEEQPGGARLALMSGSGKTILEHSDKEGVRRALTQLKLSKPFAFYDQARRIGADLELPDGKAIITFSDTVTLDDLFQSAMRCRRLIQGRHSIAYLIPVEMGGEWTGEKVIETAKRQQKQIENKANFHGICEQMRGTVRSAVDRKMRKTADYSIRHEIHRSVKKFLLEMQDNDLVKTFGSLNGMVSSQKALKRLKVHLIRCVEKILPEMKEEIEKKLKDILHWHEKRGTSLPEKVREGDEQEDAVQEVDLSKDQDRMRLMEEEYERMLGSRNPKKEVVWKSFDPEQIVATPFGSMSQNEEMPDLYSLKDALKERSYHVPFTENVLLSANLLTTFIGESNCLLTENQKPVHRCLFLRNTMTLVLLSEGDAHYLKPLVKGEGVYLLEPSGIINQRGDLNENISNLWSEGTLAERTLLLQALIFQGSAHIIDRLPRDEVMAALQSFSKNRTALRILFEAALDLHPDDLLYYRRNPKLRGLFIYEC